MIPNDEGVTNCRLALVEAMHKASRPPIFRGHSIQTKVDGRNISWTVIYDGHGALWVEGIPMSMTGGDAAQRIIAAYRFGWNDGFTAGMAAARSEIEFALRVTTFPRL